MVEQRGVMAGELKLSGIITEPVVRDHSVFLFYLLQGRGGNGEPMQHEQHVWSDLLHQSGKVPVYFIEPDILDVLVVFPDPGRNAIGPIIKGVNLMPGSLQSLF